MDNAEKERRSRKQPHQVYLERAHREPLYREHRPEYGEMLEDGFGAVDHDKE